MNFKSIALVAATIVGTCFDSFCALDGHIPLHRTANFYGEVAMLKCYGLPNTGITEESMRIEQRLRSILAPEYGGVPKNFDQWCRLIRALRRADPEYVAKFVDSNEGSVTRFEIVGWILDAHTERPDLFASAEFKNWNKNSD